ncbi:UNVERIFIED_CONTAM: hypothetical protein GTU68_010355 [Idotea baltica]|nr:hypothetical protein [Idotea baltica]
MDKNNLQDTFLNAVRITHAIDCLFGEWGKLQGVVTWFDNFCVLLRGDGRIHLNSFIACYVTIAPSGASSVVRATEARKLVKMLDKMIDRTPKACHSRCGYSLVRPRHTATEGVG